MKTIQISVFLLAALSVFHTSAFADQFECQDDGYCHQAVATEGDIGVAGDQSECGKLTFKMVTDPKAQDQTCHEISPCGGDDGKVGLNSCQH
jgi:hypothetical protein